MWGQPPSAVRRARPGCGLLSRLLRPYGFPLVGLHIHPPFPKPHALGLQPQTLLNRGVPGQLNLASGAQHPLPRQSKSTPQSRRHLPGRPRKPRCPCHSAIGRNLATRNCTHRLFDPQTHLSSYVSPLFCHPESATGRLAQRAGLRSRRILTGVSPFGYTFYPRSWGPQ
jgi:hypothetical protein